MPGGVWWVLISGGLCALSWLLGRLSRRHAPAGTGPWNTTWAVYFSPNGGASGAIIDSISSAQQTILMQAFLLHSTRLAGALVRAHQRGVQVHVILDANAQPHDPPVPAVARLLAAGIAVYLDAQHEWAHDKVMIVDGAIVITGSYNWTLAAEHKNGENLLVIRDPRLAKTYLKNWLHHADHSTPYRGVTPWWAYIRVVRVYLTHRRRKRLMSKLGEAAKLFPFLTWVKGCQRAVTGGHLRARQACSRVCAQIRLITHHPGLRQGMRAGFASSVWLISITHWTSAYSELFNGASVCGVRCMDFF